MILINIPVIHELGHNFDHLPHNGVLTQNMCDGHEPFPAFMDVMTQKYCQPGVPPHWFNIDNIENMRSGLVRE